MGWTRGVALAAIITTAKHTNTEHDWVNKVAIVLLVAHVMINVVDVHLLIPTKRAEGILRGSNGTDHRLFAKA
jgi:hypothetical protein